MTSHWWNTIMQYHELFNEIWKWKVYNKSGYTAGLNINTETRTMSGKKSSYVWRKLHIGHSRVKTQKHSVNIGLPCSGFLFMDKKRSLLFSQRQLLGFIDLFLCTLTFLWKWLDQKVTNPKGQVEIKKIITTSFIQN